MFQDLRFRFTIILLSILAACYLLWPTYKFYSLSNNDLKAYSQVDLKILKDDVVKLGLDLQGGMYVVLEADIPSLLIKSMNKPSEELEDIINEAKKISLSKQTDLFDEFKILIEDSNIRLIRHYTDLASFRDNESIIEELYSQKEQAINSVLEIIRNRVDEFGVSEPNIQRHGKDRIVVELAGITDSDRARNLIQKTASMEFLLVLNQKLPSILDKIDNLLIDLDYQSKTKIAHKVEKEDNNGLDDIFSENNYLKSDILEYSTSNELLKDNPLTAYIRLLSYGMGVSSSEVGKVKEILANQDVAQIIPKDTKFLWGNKIEKAQAEDGGFFDYRALYYVKSTPVISGGMIKNPKATIASVGSNISGQWVVNLDMSKEGARKWSRFTGANKNKQVAIALDEKVYMAPVIKDKIPSGTTQISGFADVNESKDIANVLRAGELPASVDIIQERTIGPSLGRDSIELGKNAMMLGMLLVIIFMIIYYKGAGLIADLSMILNLILVMAILTLLGASLTLPGIAGLILTIGMAVDANVIVF